MTDYCDLHDALTHQAARNQALARALQGVPAAPEPEPAEPEPNTASFDGGVP